MTEGTIFVDHTTASANVARELGEIGGEKGIGFIDAPVSGGQAGAENGILTVMCGGGQQDFARAQPVIDCFARSCVLLGPVGSGQLTKMVNQICIAGLVQGLAEALNFAQKAGLDGAKVVDVISKGAAQSWQMENRALTMDQGILVLPQQGDARLEMLDLAADHEVMSGSDQSLNTPIADSSEDSWQDFLPDQRPSPEDVVIGMRDADSRSRWLAEAIGELSPREQKIIRQRRLVDDGATLEQLGRELGVSKERVRQLEHRALTKLKASIQRRVDQPDELFVEA